MCEFKWKPILRTFMVLSLVCIQFVNMFIGYQFKGDYTEFLLTLIIIMLYTQGE